LLHPLEYRPQIPPEPVQKLPGFGQVPTDKEKRFFYQKNLDYQFLPYNYYTRNLLFSTIPLAEEAVFA
jgi:hypothetical protein